MKETILSNNEKSFVLHTIGEGKRLDGRKMDESREMLIYFGTDWGCCQVSLGETKVLAQVSCEVQQPMPTRPNEGLLFLNIELNPMGAPHFEVGRQSELAVQLNRLLEKCIKDSRCVDLESLCIVAEEKVWALRVDINVLNHDGNLVDAASVAALTALSHFRRPDVTLTGEQTIIHDPSERDPIPICLHHHPVCVSYAIFNKGENVVADPTDIEERVSEAQVVLGVNAYRELCGLHLGGSALKSQEILLQCASQAAKRSAEVVQRIKSALEEDSNARDAGKPVGFAECTRDGKILALSHKRLSLQLDTPRLRGEAQKLVRKRNKHIFYDEDGVEIENKEDVQEDVDEENEPSVVSRGRGLAELLPKQEHMRVDETVPTRAKMKEGDQNEWVKTEGGEVKRVKNDQEEESDEDSDDDMSRSSDVEVVKEISYKERLELVDSIELSGDSEEETTETLNAADMNLSNKSSEDNGKSAKKSGGKARNWYPVQKW